MSARNLLVELFVEELPPKALKILGAAFCELLTESLQTQGLLATDSVTTWFATPRRLAAHITAVAAKASDKPVQQKLMPVSVGLDATGQATGALLKRLSALGLDASSVPNLKRAMDGKAEALFLDITVRGLNLTEGLQKALDHMLSKLPIPKVMSYQLADGWSSVNFVRPVHGLVALHGGEIVPVSALGLASGRITHGHRFEASRESIELAHADAYTQQLESEGSVIASFVARRAEIVKQLHAAAKVAGLQVIEDDALLDEVTGLVERPNVVTCQFEPIFLAVPQECLILTMKANQKYFPLIDAGNKLSNKFLVVSNIRPIDPSRVIEGNERVVRPRLADAKFFFDQDRKKPLISHLEGLGRVVYHNKLGSQRDRVSRIQTLAEIALKQLPVSDSTDGLKEAAQLCKCDLLTTMVGEFPELQGIMGRYYALSDGKSEHIAEAIREHYLPRGANDELPITAFGIALAIADKIDLIAGVFAINQKPTGAKDPFGVRRAAIGIVRILIEGRVSLNLYELILNAVQRQPDQNLPSTTVQTAPLPLDVKSWYVERANEIYDYIMERLRGYYLDGARKVTIATELFDAVLENRPTSPLDFDQRLQALYNFLNLSDAQSLAAANKRISNILRKSGQESFGDVDVALLTDPAEQVLHEQVVAMAKVTEPLFLTRDYGAVLSKLANLRAAVDAFFDGVMVMADDAAIRNNRLALLAQLRGLFLRVADFSRLPG